MKFSHWLNLSQQSKFSAISNILGAYSHSRVNVYTHYSMEFTRLSIGSAGIITIKRQCFRPLDAQNRRHPAEAECRLFRCPILPDRCRFRNFGGLLSYRHRAFGPRFFSPSPRLGRGHAREKEKYFEKSIVNCRKSKNFFKPVF